MAYQLVQPTDVRSPVRLGLLAGALLAAVMGGLVVVGALDPVQLLLPGERGAGGAVMVEDFGAHRVPDGYSYDGQQYYLAARFFPDIEAAGGVVGGPRFRLLRIVLPALASPAGEGTALVLLLVAWNIVGVGLAVGSLADLAQRHGRPAGVGAAAGVALALPLLLTTAECLAFGLGLLALALAHRERAVASWITLAVAGLTRENALAFAVGMCAFWISSRRLRAAAAIPLAAVPLILWRLYLLRVLPAGPDAPLGFLDVLQVLDRSTVDQLVTAFVVVIGVYAALHWRDAILMWPIAVVFVGSILVYEYDTFDWRALPRVSAPLVAMGLAGVGAGWLRTRSDWVNPQRSSGRPIIIGQPGTRRNTDPPSSKDRM